MAETSERMPEPIGGLLNSFSCSLDKDIESFLRNRAIEFELLSKARTYLICDSDSLVLNHKIIIAGYFSLSVKNLQIPNGISNRKRKELDGFSAKIHGDVITEIPCYLIGQLAKNSSISDKLVIDGNKIIDLAISVINTAIAAVGGRYVMVECRNIEKLLGFYESNNFETISHVAYDGTPMVQLIRKLIVEPSVLSSCTSTMTLF